MDATTLSHPQIHLGHTPLDIQMPFDSPMPSWYGIEYTIMESYERFVQVGIQQPKADLIPMSSSANQSNMRRVNFDYISSTHEGQETLTGFLSCLRSSIEEQEEHFRHLHDFSTKYLAHIDNLQPDPVDRVPEKIVPEWVGIDWDQLNDDSSASIHINAIHPAKKRQGNLPRAIIEKLKTWLQEHIDNPYPNDVDKEQLLADTGLTSVQLANWFINARRRYVPKISEPKSTRKRVQIKTEPKRGRKRGPKKAK